eukprot:7400137-Alexandrium_andersonii.AAC.1
MAGRRSGIGSPNTGRSQHDNDAGRWSTLAWPRSKSWCTTTAGPWVRSAWTDCGIAMWSSLCIPPWAPAQVPAGA